MMDDLDRRILRLWQNDPKASRKSLANALGITPSLLNRRIEKLKNEKTVRGIRARVNWKRLDESVCVFLRIILDKTSENALDRFLVEARKLDEIVVIETLLGRVDVRMDVVARDLAHFQEIYAQKILALPHIQDIESLLLLSEVKAGERLPI